MGQKTNPLSLRIQSKTRCFDQAWYSDYFYSQLLANDLAIVHYVNTFLQLLKLPASRVSIYHLPKTTKLYSFFCYPQHTRDSKSKMFHISTGLKRSRTKTFTSSGKSGTKSSGYPTHQAAFRNKAALFQSILFEKISLFKTNSSFLSAKTQHTPFSLGFCSLGLYNLFQSKKLIQIHPQSNSTQIDSLALQNQTFEKIPSKFMKLETPFLHVSSNFTKNIFHSYTLPFSKNSHAQHLHSEKLTGKHIVNIFDQFLGFSIREKTLYRLPSQKHDSFTPSSSTQTVLKYTLSGERHLSKFLNTPVSMIPFQAASEWQDAGYFADEIKFLLERRVSFRQLKRKVVKQLMSNPLIQGVRITCAGRVGGKSKKAQRAKRESIKYGQTSLHIFSSRIDFAVRTASTSLGSTGVKVWICYK